VASGLGNFPTGIAFDGVDIWTANNGGSVSIITPTTNLPWSVNTVSTGFFNPAGILFDGSNIWVTDASPGTLVKLDQNANFLQKVNVGNGPHRLAFDGTNIWVPNFSDNTVSLVRAATGAVLSTLSCNGLNGPDQAAFDGQRVLVTNFSGDSVSLWKAADLNPIGTFATGTNTTPSGTCSDGTYFWITLHNTGQLARF
jgi:DNA-binding beta-propeller fold protein YncE